MSRLPKRLRVFFDEDCPLCLRVADSFSKEECYVPMEMLPMRASITKEEFRHLAPYIESGRFVAQDDGGAIYFDTKARLMMLYATKRFRSLSFECSAPGVSGLVDFIFENISKRRGSIAGAFDKSETESLRNAFCKKTGCAV